MKKIPPFWHLNLFFFETSHVLSKCSKKTFNMVHHPHPIFIVIWLFPKKHISLNAKTVSLSMFTMIRWFQNYLKPSFDNEVLRKKKKDPGLWSFVKFGFGRTKRAKQYPKHGAKTCSFLQKKAFWAIKSIGSMGLVYLPTFTIKINQSRQIYHTWILWVSISSPQICKNTNDFHHIGTKKFPKKRHTDDGPRDSTQQLANLRKLRTTRWSRIWGSCRFWLLEKSSTNRKLWEKPQVLYANVFCLRSDRQTKQFHSQIKFIGS